MKFLFLKFRRDKLPPVGSLRPPIFNSESYWFFALGVCALIFIVTAFIGGKIFYSQYVEDYKKSDPSESSNGLIDIQGLENAIQRRNDFLNKQSDLLRDPSL